MAQLTLRTLLAYLDDTLEPTLARQLGLKVAESELAQELIERIKKVTRRRGLKTPTPTGPDDETADPNTVAEYLSDTLDSQHLEHFEETCLDSDVHLAEVAACHQILTLLLAEPVRVPPRARQRMYALVPPPASVPNRKPGKTMPVGSVLPAAAEKSESDDTDVTLLLGLGRYSTGSWWTRAGLVASGAALALMLLIAVVMALPPGQPEPPASSQNYAAVTAPHDATASKAAPAQAGAIPPPRPAPEKSAKPRKKPDEAKAPEPGKEKKLINEPIGARADRVPIGEARGLNTIMLTRSDDGPSWLRLDPAGEKGVTSYDQVVCLPGFKGDVQLESGVKVHLWGNVPELLPSRLLESRVRFHVPIPNPDGKGRESDADITLLEGRIYFSTDRAEGAKVRVRFGREIWDFTLPDSKSEVMVEVITSYVPGAPFAREDGPPPRVEANAAVLRGSASLDPGKPAKSFSDIAAPAFVEWDSKTGTVAPPEPIKPGNEYYNKFPLLLSDMAKTVEKAKTEMAGQPIKRDGVKLMLMELLSEPPSLDRMVTTQLAVCGYTAIITGDNGGDDLKPLVDLLHEETRGYARMAVLNPLSAWVAQDPGNTALLEKQIAAKTDREGEPETIVRLLRGYVSPTDPDPAALDRLVDLLNSPSVAVRELAQWNLINFVDRTAVQTEGMFRDVGFTGPDYEKYVKRWKARIAEIKAKPDKGEPEKKEPEKKQPKPTKDVKENKQPMEKKEPMEKK
jgi:hypothetical protein